MSGRGDEEQWAELYPGLRRFAAIMGDWEQEPDDLVQEAVARTLRRKRLADLNDPAAYLRQAIANIATSGRRSRAARQRAVHRLGPAEVRVDEMPSELADLARIGPLDRAVVYLVHLEGRSHSEVARILGISEQASRSRLTRALQQLRREFAEEASDGSR